MYKTNITNKQRDELLRLMTDLDFKGDTESFITGYMATKISIPVELPVSPMLADNYSFAILILDDMKLKLFKHKDELENAKDVLLKNAKRLIYFKKDKNGYWIKPDVYE